MTLTDFARQLPPEVWELFEPLLPPVVWYGNGRPPASHSDCLHALFSVRVSGIAWRMLPKGFPSYKTVQRRLKDWLQCATFRPAWQQLAQRSEAFQGIKLHSGPALLVPSAGCWPPGERVRLGGNQTTRVGAKHARYNTPLSYTIFQ